MRLDFEEAQIYAWITWQHSCRTRGDLKKKFEGNAYMGGEREEEEEVWWMEDNRVFPPITYIT